MCGYRFRKTLVKEALEGIRLMKVVSHDRFIDSNSDIGDQRFEIKFEAALIDYVSAASIIENSGFSL